MHERAWETAPVRPRSDAPQATYTLLGVMGVVWVLELLMAPMETLVRYHGATFDLAYWTFIINTDWVWRPWTLVTSTMAHDVGTFSHLLFNGLFLFFFGPIVERILGARRYVTLFFVAGAVSGVLQVHLSHALGHTGGALGASGALMALFGVVVILLPRERLYVYGILPVPMWLAGLGYAAIDALGLLNPYSPIGNIAHLSGLALGLGVGIWFRSDMKKRGLVLRRGP